MFTYSFLCHYRAAISQVCSPPPKSKAINANSNTSLCNSQMIIKHFWIFTCVSYFCSIPPSFLQQTLSTVIWNICAWKVIWSSSNGKIPWRWGTLRSIYTTNAMWCLNASIDGVWWAITAHYRKKRPQDSDAQLPTLFSISMMIRKKLLKKMFQLIV